jgi:SAM-dependent methyltransferase
VPEWSGEERRRAFDSVAATYEAARPAYPVELFDDLVRLAELGPGNRLLEIGCATGKATLPLLHRGYTVVCVELGPDLIDQARRNFEGLPAELIWSEFETWDARPREFDLVYAATAWHWLDPEIRYRKAHEHLRPGGHLAFWAAMHAYPAGFDPFFTEIHEVYDAIGEGWNEAWPPPPPEEMHDYTPEIEATGLFEAVGVRRYLWDAWYTAEEYIALINTFSGHIAMEPAKRERLYAEIRRRIAARPEPRVRRHWCSVLHVARAISSPEPDDERWLPG